MDKSKVGSHSHEECFNRLFKSGFDRTSRHPSKPLKNNFPISIGIHCKGILKRINGVFERLVERSQHLYKRFTMQPKIFLQLEPAG